MAKNPNLPERDANAPAKKTRAGAKLKPVYILFDIVDRDGNKIEGAEVKVHQMTKDFAQIARIMPRLLKGEMGGYLIVEPSNLQAEAVPAKEAGAE